MGISPVCDWYHQWRWPNVMFHSTFIEFRRSALRRRFQWGSIQKDRNHWSLITLVVGSDCSIFLGGAWHIIVPHFQFCLAQCLIWSGVTGQGKAPTETHAGILCRNMWFKQFGNAQSESENDGQVNRRLSWIKKSTLWIYVGGSLLRSSTRQVNPSVVVFCCWNRNVWITRALLLILPGPIMPWWLSLECQLGWNSHLQRRLLGEISMSRFVDQHPLPKILRNLLLL